MRTGRLAETGPVLETPNPVPPDMASEDTRPTTDNTGGTLTEAELINYLHDVDRAVSVDQLAKRTGTTREGIKARVKSLEKRGLIVVSMGLYHVTIQFVNGVEAVADGGRIQDAPDAVDLTPAQVYTVLSNERRRETIRVLARQSRQDSSLEDTYTPVSTLAAVVCASEEDFAPANDVAADDQHATYVSLTQTHLPMLANLGVIEYYSRVQKVRPTGTVPAVEQLMDAVDDFTDYADRQNDLPGQED